MALRRGELRLGDRADRELARGLGQRDPRPARGRGERRRDRRRGAAARVRHSLIARGEPLELARSRRCSPTRRCRGSARASCAASWRSARVLPASSTAEAVRIGESPSATARAGGDRDAARGAHLRRHGAARGRRGSRRTTRRASSGWRGRSASGRTASTAAARRAGGALEDLAAVLGRRAPSAPGWLVRCLDGVRRSARST